MSRTKVALVPSYEPDENLKRVVDDLLRNNFEVVVVNDGSSKEYDKYFNIKAKVISYSNNRGKGYALKTGLKYINENYKNYIVVTMDSDGQHTVEDAIKLCNYVEDNPDILVLGSRKRNKSIPLRSYLGNSITRFVYSLATKMDIYDTQTGLRAFSDILVPYMLKIDGNRFEYEMNVLLNAKRNNIRIKELTIKTIYIDNNSKSHFNTIKDSFKIYKEIIKFSMTSILSFIIDYLLYILLIIFSKNLVLSNVGARGVSSLINYSVNRKYVFRNNRKNSLINYYMLVVVILILNTMILSLLSLVIDVYSAKILTELILFICSYLVQKHLIFKNEKID